MLKPDQEMLLNAGSWIGRQQAFAVIANKCSAAQALCLKQIRESSAHDQLGLGWEEFCEQYVGLSHRQANRLISQYDEFGEAYFRLSNLACISPETYREVAPAVTGECIEIDGEQVALVPANAARIRAFVKSRVQAAKAERRGDPLAPRTIDVHLQQAVIAAQECVTRPLSAADREYLQRLVGYAIQQWVAIGQKLDKLGTRN
jgi:hypothetical protein